MILILLLALAFGSPDFSFPWWVWVLALIDSFAEGRKHVVEIYDRRTRVNGEDVP